MIYILEEPTGHAYTQLVSLAFDICDEFTLVRQDQSELDHRGIAFFEQVQPYIKEIRKQDEWPNTKLLDHTADVYYFDCNNEALKEILISTVDRLYGWVRQGMPEDLCFYKDGKEWLVTTAHEHTAFVKTTVHEELQRLGQIEDLMVY